MDILFSILLLFFFITAAIFIIDAIPQFNTWQSRIKIGRFYNKEDNLTRILSKQIVMPVQWKEVINQMKENNITVMTYNDIERLYKLLKSC